MKKLAALIMTLAMVLAMALPAFADDSPVTVQGDGTNPTSGNTATFDVKAKYTAGSEMVVNRKYKVVITWTVTDGDFYGNKAGTYTWNPDTLKYILSEGTNNAAGDEVQPKVAITVENRSDSAMKASAVYAPAESNGTSATFTPVNLASAWNKTEVNSTDTGTEKSGDLSANIDMGSLDKTTLTTLTTIGTVTVTIESNETTAP